MNYTNTIRWGPYTQAFEPLTSQYFLFRDPDPEPIRQSRNPILKEPVSLFLSEVLKPLNIESTAVAGLSKDSKPNESVIKAAIAMMDEEIIGKVRSAAEQRTALTILSFYDPRFCEGLDSQEWCMRLLKYFNLQSGSNSSKPRTRKRPGPHSPKRAAIWDYIHSHDIAAVLKRSNSLPSRKRLAEKIGAALESQMPNEFFGAGSKPDSDVMAVLRQFSQKQIPRKKRRRKPVRP
jgi:hypothetical protein